MVTDNKPESLDRGMSARVRAARVNVRNAAKLRIIPVDRVIELSEMPLHPGDYFDAGEVLKKVPGWQSRSATQEGDEPETVRWPKLSRRTRRRIALMVLRGELTVLSDSLTQFAPDARGGRLVLGFEGSDERDAVDVARPSSKTADPAENETVKSKTTGMVTGAD